MDLNLKIFKLFFSALFILLNRTSTVISEFKKEVNIPLTELYTGAKIPQLGITSFISDKYSNVVEQAFELGIELFEADYIGKREYVLGEAMDNCIRKTERKREDFFIIAKLWNTYHRPEFMQEATRESLTKLQSPYIDLYLINWPMAFQFARDGYARSLFGEYDYEITLEQTWAGMESLLRANFTRHIGLANFNITQLERIMKVATIKPAAIMLEINPYMVPKKIIEYCAKHNIKVLATNPFYGPNNSHSKRMQYDMFNERIVRQLREKYNKTSTQILLRFLIDLGTIPIFRVASLEELKSDTDIFDFSLEKEEVDEIAKLDINLRTLRLDYCTDHPEYPFVEYRQIFPNIL